MHCQEIKKAYVSRMPAACKSCIRRTHEHSINGINSKEYKKWTKIKQICFNKNHPKYNIFKMQEDWINSFETFLKDVGLAPSKKHCLLRADLEGDYTADNLEWKESIKR